MARRLLIRAAQGDQSMTFKLLFLGLAMAVPASIFFVQHNSRDPSSRQVELQFIERAPGSSATDTTTMVVSATGDRGCSEVNTHQPDNEYDVKLCPEGGDRDAPIFRFSIADSFRKDGQAPNNISLKAVSHLKNGKATLIGKILRSDGTQLTIMARADS
jgi:hypothetical protein